MAKKFNRKSFHLLTLFLLILFHCTNGINVGVGIGDTTGPAAEIGMMGYAKQGQSTKGIHMRLYSRAFIFVDELTKKRSVFVSVDCAMMGQLIKHEVVSKLRANYGNLYDYANVVLSATHTHSGPAGYLQYVLFEVSSAGFIQKSFKGLVDGIYESIRMAHDKIRPARIYHTQGEIHDANINRSPTSYLVNPEEEINQYEFDCDHLVEQLTIVSADEPAVPMGVINWFAVHPTSMNNTNRLISGDNKGLASQMLEKEINGPDILSGKGPFVAAFASANLGDVSPNLQGPKCLDTGLPCDLYQSTCDGRTQNCVAFGPGSDMLESTYIIADRQFKEALRLLKNTTEIQEVEGPVRSVHQWINMANQEVVLDNGQVGRTCPPALGYSFAAGTTDGPGEFDFTQGTNNTNLFWDFVAGLLKDPSQEQEDCHAPKPILLDTGEISFPYKWHPDIIDTQILQIGNVLVAALPGEFTTMAGRRLRRTVETKAKQVLGNDGDAKVILAGLANAYTHYITTFEEYQRQRYEAASTIYGPHTLQAYLQQYSYLTEQILKNETDIEQGDMPPNLYEDQLSFVPGVLFDNPPVGHAFGDCLLQPPQEVHQGDTVKVRFVSGHPRNDLMLGKTFLAVQQLDRSSGQWKVVLTDNDWETQFEWFRTNVLLGESEVEIRWDIKNWLGTFRIVHYGAYKKLIDPHKLHFYSGQTDHFEVKPATVRRSGLSKKPARINPNLFTHLNKLFSKHFNIHFT